MSEIYKYTSVESAISILKNESVRLTNPKNFNDPYDCNFDQDVKDKKKIDKLLENYYVLKAFDQLVSDEKIKVKDNTSKIVLSVIRMEMEIMRVLLRKRPFFSRILGFNFLLNILYKFNGNIKQLVDEELKKIDDFIQKGLIEIKSSIGISCFSKKNNSILMWSHYAAEHKGFCIKYNLSKHFIKQAENDQHEHMYLKKIKYSDEKTSILTYTIKSDLAFATKKKDWEYENEVRLIVYNPNNEDSHYGIELDNDSRIEAIFFGYRCPENTINTIKSIFYQQQNKDIKFYKMDLDEADVYSLRYVEL